MRDFVVIDFETANPQRVSACAIGYTIVENMEIVQCDGSLIKPVGGHAAFQTKIHGITESDTANEGDFGQIYAAVSHLFEMPIVGHSLFDKQVLNALSEYFDLGIHFDYVDSVAVAKQKLPELKNYKLKTLVKHFGLPKYKHHDAVEDARACALVFLRLHGTTQLAAPSLRQEFALLASAILDDNLVEYREAYQLLYWLEDHIGEVDGLDHLLDLIKTALADDVLDEIESEEIKSMLRLSLKNL